MCRYDENALLRFDCVRAVCRYKTNGFLRFGSALPSTSCVSSAAARALCTRDCLSCLVPAAFLEVPCTDLDRRLFELLRCIACFSLANFRSLSVAT